MNTTKRSLLLAVGVALTCFTQVGRADPIPYAGVGSVNPASYTFTAAATGDVIGYFGGSGAAWTEDVAMLVNGVISPAGFGLATHSTLVGASFNFGAVTAGDDITFVLRITNSGGSLPTNQLWYSNPALNPDIGYGSESNHLYSTAATAGQVFSGSPAGTYVAFEDAPLNASDLNYFDDTFVFTNVSTQVSGVPEGGTTVALLGSVLLGLAAVRRRFARA